MQQGQIYTLNEAKLVLARSGSLSIQQPQSAAASVGSLSKHPQSINQLSGISFNSNLSQQPLSINQLSGASVSNLTQQPNSIHLLSGGSVSNLTQQPHSIHQLSMDDNTLTANGPAASQQQSNSSMNHSFIGDERPILQQNVQNVPIYEFERNWRSDWINVMYTLFRNKFLNTELAQAL